MEAMKRALERNILTWAYVRSILKAWEKKGIRTVAGAEAELVGFQRERGRKYGGGGGYFVGEDIVPDWYDEEKERQRLREAIREEEKRGTREEVEERMRELGIGAE